MDRSKAAVKDKRRDIVSTRGIYQEVAKVLRDARNKVYRAVNFTMVEAYWHVGRMIVEEEQRGKERAEYGAFLIKELSSRLTGEFGKGFSEPSLWNMRQFYRSFPILSALRRELTWTHYKSLIRIEKETARSWYMEAAAEQNWSTRALNRQINSFYYDRLLMSRNKEPVIEEMQQKTAPLAASSRDFIKDPYVLEFLDIPDDNPTVGLILCSEKDHTIVKYSVLEESQQLFAASYQRYLPTEQELIEEIERGKDHIIRERAISYEALRIAIAAQ
jgi:hypothetical protein